MSVHILKKGVDKRFVDALVTTDWWFTPDHEEYEEEYNSTYFQPNYNRKKWHKDYTNSKWIIHAVPQWYIDNSTDWLNDYIEHLFAAVSNENYHSIAIPVDIAPEHPVSFSQMYQAVSLYAPDTMLVYIITNPPEKNIQSQLYPEINRYIESKLSPAEKTLSVFGKNESEKSSDIPNWFGDIKNAYDLKDDYLNDIISILKRNSTAEKTDKAQSVNLEEYVAEGNNSFAEMLFAFIDEKGVDEVDCYKQANVNRRTFSKIRTDKSYHPSKKTVLAFAVSLKLTYEEAEALLRSAGYTFSNSSKLDLIVEYFIINGKYDIFEINEALFAFDQPLLDM